MNIVIDTNRFISALIKDGITRRIIFDTNDVLLFPEFELEETLNHKAEILQKSGLSEKDFSFLFYRLLNRFKIINTEKIIKYKDEADNIMKNIDPDDSIFVATALAFDCPIWSEDNDFKRQNRINVINNKNMIDRLI